MVEGGVGGVDAKSIDKEDIKSASLESTLVPGIYTDSSYTVIKLCGAFPVEMDALYLGYGEDVVELSRADTDSVREEVLVNDGRVIKCIKSVNNVLLGCGVLIIQVLDNALGAFVVERLHSLRDSFTFLWSETVYLL